MNQPTKTIRRTQPSTRRGIALLDALIGGVLLGIGLAVVLSIGSRALNNHQEGERRLQAAWLADELCSLILVEGPEQYGRLYDLSGAFEPPFDQFLYDIDIDNREPALPARVRVVISWPGARSPVDVETYIAKRKGYEDEPEPLREPVEVIERQQRWDDYHDELEQSMGN